MLTPLHSLCSPPGVLGQPGGAGAEQAFECGTQKCGVAPYDLAAGVRGGTYTRTRFCPITSSSWFLEASCPW